MSRILINLEVPTIGRKYNLWILDDKRIYDTIRLMVKGIDELNDECYKPKKMPLLYSKDSGERYDINLTAKEADIKNGTEVILV